MRRKFKIEIFVYRSNIKSKKIAKIILLKLAEKFPKIESSFDLEDKDKIYRLEATQEQKKEIETFLNDNNVEIIELY